MSAEAILSPPQAPPPISYRQMVVILPEPQTSCCDSSSFHFHLANASAAMLVAASLLVADQALAFKMRAVSLELEAVSEVAKASRHESVSLPDELESFFMKDLFYVTTIPITRQKQKLAIKFSMKSLDQQELQNFVQSEY
ncbi:hypothetical protein E2562_039247 [Oryza meyeriana var. granulata]|uniref:Uncharacterized protein n=1 Tax=Oryza meyeriana var. granulata TaxID=110450 RepID=A0A6G1CXY4_9ORYZ|nr:hypothetical protein E2562_039247 [Oryza meyeriana var. granulata]